MKMGDIIGMTVALIVIVLVGVYVFLGGLW